MPRHITPHTSLENLKREAKRWLKALRTGDADARARLDRANSAAPQAPALRHVQHALAREFGLSGWRALKDALAEPDHRPRASAELITRFLDNACPDHHVRGGPDHVRARHTAMRLLERYPDIAQSNLYTAMVCGDLAMVEQMLAEQPELANRKSSDPAPARSKVGDSGDLYHDLGAKGWEPLLYLCFTRLPLPAANENALPIARLLLEHGADPTVYFKAGGSKYTPLVGAIGEGEEDRPAHPQRDALVKLLLDRGANPYDNQVIYNLRFHAKVLWFLKLSYARSLELGRKADWDDPEWSMLNMGGYGSGARWHLDLAISHNDIELAEWCLAHGASPNAAPARAERFSKRTLYEDAVLQGRTEIAELLLQYGAVRSDVSPDPIALLVAACMRLDRDEVRAQIAAHPEYLQSTEPLFAAAREDRADVAAFLLELGWKPDLENAQKERALHIAGYANAINVAKLLIAHGAEIDPVESNWGNTPMGAAAYSQSLGMLDLLGPYSHDVWGLTFAGKLERLREVLADKPERARVAYDGHTPLMWLPTFDERLAIEVAEVFLSHGADPSLRNRDGMTAADRAEQIGMFELAELLRGKSGA
jgi:uncharacterized protein